MPTDPNADLIGFQYGLGNVVTGVAPWDPSYVEVMTPFGPTVRVAAQVRRRKELG